MTILAGEARQAEWTEKDDQGRPAMYVTNTVRLVNPRWVWLLGERQDQPERSDWSLAHDVSVSFQQRERPEIEAFEKEHAAFEALPPSLMANYRGQFVAIHNGAPVDSDTSRSNLVRRFFERFGDSPVYIGYVGKVPISYQVTPFQL